ncbi:MAG: fibronectin type III domain-containing protein, partial [Actinomycetes bacterium]
MKRSLVSLLALAAVSGLVLPAVMASSAQAVVAGPVNLAPDDNSTYQKNVVLTWDDVSGATGYEVQVSADGFGTDSDVLDDTTLSNRYVVPVDLPRSDYVWRVRATLPGATSDWSSSAQLVRGWDPSVAP